MLDIKFLYGCAKPTIAVLYQVGISPPIYCRNNFRHFHFFHFCVFDFLYLNLKLTHIGAVLQTRV